MVWDSGLKQKGENWEVVSPNYVTVWDRDSQSVQVSVFVYKCKVTIFSFFSKEQNIRTYTHIKHEMMGYRGDYLIYLRLLILLLIVMHHTQTWWKYTNSKFK